MTMKTILAALLLIIGAMNIGAAQEKSETWEGYLADAMCANRWRGRLAETYAKRHTKSCAYHEDCRASGFGVFLNGKFTKFTKETELKAIEYLDSIDKRNDMYVRVTGVHVKGEIHVEKIAGLEM